MNRKGIWDEPDRTNPYGNKIQGQDSSEFEDSVSDDSSSEGIIRPQVPMVKKQAKITREES